MARRAKDGAANGNGVDPEVIKSAMSDLEACAEDLATEKGRYMQACGVIRERMVGIYDDADARGCTRTELKAIFKASQQIAKAHRTIAKLERDEHDRAAMMADALGNDDLMPLFVEAKRRRTRNADASAAA